MDRGYPGRGNGEAAEEAPSRLVRISVVALGAALDRLRETVMAAIERRD
jgi:hypothetical protein